MTTLRKCPLQCSLTNMCHKCELSHLSTQITELKSQLNFILNQSHKIFDHTSSKEMSLKYTIYNDFSNNQWEFTPMNSYFITITFDPNKFGHSNQSHDEKVYIMYELEQCYKKELIYDYYGCFEKQSNGTIHAHMVGYSSKIHELRRYLKHAFTDNPHNNKAVDIGSAKDKRSIQYIDTEEGDNKQKFGFFYNYKKRSVATAVSELVGARRDAEQETNATRPERKVYNITAQIIQEVDKKLGL